MLNPPIVLAIPHLTPTIQKKKTYAIYLDIALRLTRICNNDETFEKRSSEYQNYLYARDHKLSKVKNEFSEAKKKTRSEAREKQSKQDKVSDLKSITTYNPTLSKIHDFIQNNLLILHTY